MLPMMKSVAHGLRQSTSTPVETINPNHQTDPRMTKSKTKPADSTAKKDGERRLGFPIVGVGASAGGLEAFMRLLKYLPADTGMAFVLVQHLDPQHDSALTYLMARTTSMPVQEVTHNLAVEGPD